MITIKHNASTLTPELIQSYFGTKTSPIKISLQSQSEDDPVETTVNRNLYTKGCGSQELAQACKSGQRELNLQVPGDLTRLLSQRSTYKPLYSNFMRYLASGKLEFQMKYLHFVFLLAGAFRVQGFFRSLIDQNINIPWDNKQCKRIILQHSFESFNDLLSEEGRYNFIWWMFKRYPKFPWLEAAKVQFQEDSGSMEVFIQNFIEYKMWNSSLCSEDIDTLIDTYKDMGKSSDEARERLKRKIKWEMVSVSVIDENKRNLKFSNEELRSLLQKRLGKLDEGRNGYVDEQLQQLRQRRDQLKSQYQQIGTKIGVLKIRLELTKNGSMAEPQRTSYENNYLSNYQYNQYNQNNQHYNQYESQGYPSFQNQNSGMSEEQELEMEAARMLESRNFKPPNQKKPRPPPKSQQKPLGYGLVHLQQNRGCDGRKEVHLNCGCAVCHTCIKMRYIQRTQRYQEIDDTTFREEDFKKYKIYCYKCSKVLDPIDAVTYNSMK